MFETVYQYVCENTLFVYLVGFPIWFIWCAIIDPTKEKTSHVINVLAYTFAALIWPLDLAFFILSLVALFSGGIGKLFR